MKRTIKLLLYYFLYQVGGICVMMFVYTLIHGFGARLGGGGTHFLEGLSLPLTYTLIANVGGSLCFAWHLLARRYVPATRRTFAPYSSVLMFTVVILTFSTMVWMNYLTELLHLPNNMEETFRQMAGNVWGILSIAVVAPFFEELLFRGAIESHLLRIWKNPWAGILVSALIFGVIHGNPAQIPFAFGLGVLLGWMYYRTGSLLPGILLHFINNTTSVVLMHVLPESSNSIRGMLGDTTALWLSAAMLVVTAVSIWTIRQHTFPFNWEKEAKAA